MILKPNEQEANAACIGLFGEVDYRRLCAHGDSRCVVVTRGARGAVVVENGAESVVPGFPVMEPLDVSGAGDSFSAAAALALAITGSAMEAARLGNLVASIAIQKRGAAVVSREEVLAAANASVTAP